MAASFVVSLTVIPVLCSLLLNPKPADSHRDGFIVRLLKTTLRATWLRLALSQPLLVLAIAGVLLVAAACLYPMMGKDFLPTFNEGSATISLAGAPGHFAPAV
jgi:Cu/Ag efflux pump CusA